MKKIITYICIAAVFAATACSDFLKEYSQDLVVPKTPSDLDEVLVGGVDGYLPSLEISNYGDAMSVPGAWFNLLDDDINTVIARMATTGWMAMANFYFGYTTWQLEVGRNLNGNSLAEDDQLWADLYRRINAMNIILKQLEDISIENDKDRLDAARIQGECLFLRAHFYFTLANIYGKAYSPATAETDLAVPLKLTEYVEYDKEKDVIFPRASVKAVYAQIVADLTRSAELLTESPQGKPRYRASKEAALLLLSRVYLYMQEWTSAKQAAEDLLKSKNTLQSFAALGETDNVVTVANPELIFTQGSLTMQDEEGFGGFGGKFCISSDLYALYADNDYRKTVYFAPNIDTDSIAFTRKYATGIHRSQVSDVFSLRTAEAYLNAAEASAMLDDFAAAQSHLNTLRNSRYRDNEPVALSGAELVNEIRNERRRELCLEGHRWFDLRRYAADVKYPSKKEIQRTFAIYDYENQNLYLTARVYTLSVDDDAYVFQIPKTLLDQEPAQIANPRKLRAFTPYVKVEETPTSDDGQP